MGPQPNKAAWCHPVSCPMGTTQRCSLELACFGHSSPAKGSSSPLPPQNRVVWRKILFKAVAESQLKGLIYVIKKKTHWRFTQEKLKKTPHPGRKAQCWNIARFHSCLAHRASEAETSWELIMLVENLGSSQRDVVGNVVTKGHLAVYLLYT